MDCPKLQKILLLIANSTLFTITILFVTISIPMNYDNDFCKRNMALWLVVSFINFYLF